MRGVLFSRIHWMMRDRWYWHVKGDNNEIIAVGEAYNSKLAAMDTLIKLRGKNTWPIEDKSGRKLTRYGDPLPTQYDPRMQHKIKP